MAAPKPTVDQLVLAAGYKQDSGRPYAITDADLKFLSLFILQPDWELVAIDTEVTSAGDEWYFQLEEDGWGFAKIDFTGTIRSYTRPFFRPTSGKKFANVLRDDVFASPRTPSMTVMDYDVIKAKARETRTCNLCGKNADVGLACWWCGAS